MLEMLRVWALGLAFGFRVQAVWSSERGAYRAALEFRPVRAQVPPVGALGTLKLYFWDTWTVHVPS